MLAENYDRLFGLITKHILGASFGHRRPNWKRSEKMNRQVSKPQIFWAPALETARKIDDSDTVTAIESARYRFSTCMADLERHYDAEASKLRAAFVHDYRRYGLA